MASASSPVGSWLAISERDYAVEGGRGTYVPVEGVVPNLSGIVEDAAGLGHDELLEGLGGLWEEAVEVVDVATDRIGEGGRTSGDAFRSGS